MRDSGYAPINGAQLYYEISGADNPTTLVMIHAGICDHRMWNEQVTYFAQAYRVVTMDLRGFGRSPMVEGSFAPTRDLAGLLDYLEIDSAWLVGCSLGGRVALDYALTYPDRARGLALVAPAVSGFLYEGEPHPLQDAIDAAYVSGNMGLTSELEMRMWVDGVGRAPDQVDPAVRDLVREMNLIPLRVDEALWDQELALDPPAFEHLKRITQPVLLIIGDLDIPNSLARAEVLAQRLPHVQKVTMTGTAHLPNMEEPAQFNAILSAFLDVWSTR